MGRKVRRLLTKNGTHQLVVLEDIQPENYLLHQVKFYMSMLEVLELMEPLDIMEVV